MLETKAAQLDGLQSKVADIIAEEIQNQQQIDQNLDFMI